MHGSALRLAVASPTFGLAFESRSTGLGCGGSHKSSGITLLWSEARAQEYDAMGIIAWIIFGLIAGAIAKMVMPGKDPGGFIVTIICSSTT